MTTLPSDNINGAPSPCKKRAVEAFVADAIDIRDLLYKYRGQLDLLKDDVGRCVCRELDEQDKFSRLRECVEQVEMTSLRDLRFLEYLARRQAEEKSTISRAVSAGPQTVTSCSGCVEAPNASADFQWWAQRMKADGSSWLLSWAPDAALPLVSFRSVSDVWHGWKHESATYKETFKRMLADVYSTTASPSCSHVRYCCFGNGALCVFPLEDTAIMDDFERSVSQMSRASCDSFSEAPPPLCYCSSSSSNAGHAIIVAALINRYCAALTRAVAMTCHEFHERVFTLLQGEKLGSDGGHHTTVAEHFRLINDTWDTLTFVHPNRLENTVMMRGFFFKGELALVEQLGAEADVVPLFFAQENGSDELDERGRRVQRFLSHTFTTLYTELKRVCEGFEMMDEAALPPNAALTVAVMIPLLECDVAHGVLLDVRPVGPQMPLDGRVAWIDVCAVGRQCAAATPGKTHKPLGAAAAVSSGSVDEKSSVLFHLTRLPVASLQPYDTVSCRVFPLINRQLTSLQRCTHQGIDKSVEVPKRGVLDIFHSAMTMPAPVCAGVVVLGTAVAIGVVRWVRR
ncbi:hypothetical protein JKF63_05478 [Porcisia hertigi]|uniref:Uncharacterized protein n=1 Tax=Porcisia hertigi TaxID=2761500 RepID=A0A836LF62_9TRYP|nr:hypothetical protein JKF63_05478 [Porcisia hertigi]